MDQQEALRKESEMEELNPTQSEGQKQENFSDSGFEESENPFGFLSKKTISLVLGVVVIIFIVPFLIFNLTKLHRSNTLSNASAKATLSPTLSPLGGKSQPQTKVSAVNGKTKAGLPSTLAVKAYKDPVFGYSLSIPENWETFKRAGSARAYQVAFRPVGSSDIPFTIAAQPAVSETQWIDAQFGTNYPRQKAQIAGKSAILVVTNTYKSYFTHDASYAYDISEATGRASYFSSFQIMLSSLKLAN